MTASHLFKKLYQLSLASMIGVMILSSCTSDTTPVVESTPVPSVTPSPTPEPVKKLTVCLGEEPSSLYLYGNSSQAMWSVLEAIYDGPIDTINNTPKPVILEELPTLANGGVTLQSAVVKAGDRVANIEGDVVALQKGVKVFPEGCNSPTCAVEWDGSSELSLSQMKATFKLLPGITWSDGMPLTASDSVYSYQLSGDPETNVSKKSFNLTAAYEATDELTVEWTGIPGYLSMRPATFFWIPQPQHLMQGQTAAELNAADLTTKTPVGWGAYQIAEWVPGESIRLVKNPNYFRVAEGLPAFDELVYRFVPTSPESDLSPIVHGECDIMDASTGLEDQIQSVRELELAGELTSYFGQGPAFEAIYLGINPASYDEVFNAFIDRPAFFSDLRTRQAINYCIDRDSIKSDLMFSQSDIPASYLPPQHPLAVDGLSVLSYDPAKAIALLEEAGWVDADGDPETPRTSNGVKDVVNGKDFAITYTTTDTTLHRQISESITKSLKECGVKVTTQYLPVSELVASGPEGVLFGRNFDLAEISWATGNVPPCFLFSTSEIPAEKNGWLGTKYAGVNLTGYSNPDYDAACANLLTAGLDETLYNASNEITQTIIANDLPMIPLFYQIKAMAARPDLCGLTMDTSARSALNSIESLILSDTCPAK